MSSAIACACPFFALYVCWIAGCCLRPRFDVLPLRTRLESTHDDLYSSKGYWFRKWNGRKKIDKKKNKGKKTSNKHEQWPLLKDQSWNWRCFIVFDLPPPPQAIEAVPLSWAFCENCLSVLCEFFHSMMTALNRWAPPLLSTGASWSWQPFLGTFLGCSKRVPRPRCENRKA